MNPGRLVFPALRWKEATGFAHEEAAIEAAMVYGAGGFIFFGGPADTVAELTARLTRDAGRPLLMAADLERGAGQQFRGLSELPPPRALASLHDPALLRGAGILTAVEARSIGISWVLAPVSDLDIEPENPIVQTRSFGNDPMAVAAAVAAWTVGCEAAGALACAKHFPGHGRTRTDSHDGVPSVGASREELLDSDLVPFRAAIEAGVSSVMTAHVAFPALDPTGTPATFSRPILDLLRQELGFTGLVVSDALMMDGARTGRTAGAIGLEALRAGVDLLLYPDSPALVAEALEAAAASDAAAARRVDESLLRYHAALEAADPADRPERPSPSGAALATADWLLNGPLLRGEVPTLVPPLELMVVDDDLGTPWPVSPSTWVRDELTARGVPLGKGGSQVVLVFAEPRASKGRSGLSEANRARLAELSGSSALTVLFAHPRLVQDLPGSGPVLLGWHRQRLMQDGAARWLAEHLA